MVIEAVFEDLAFKKTVFALIDNHARPGAVLATNTSYLDIDDIAGSTSRPQDVLATDMALGSKLRKIPVNSENAFGFIGNRIYNAYRRQCEFMLEDGAWPEDVDSALTGVGFAMRPFAVADLSGLDIAWRMRKAPNCRPRFARALCRRAGPAVRD